MRIFAFFKQHYPHGDLTNEYLRAVTEHGLQYTDLRQILRDDLNHSFINMPHRGATSA